MCQKVFNAHFGCNEIWGHLEVGVKYVHNFWIPTKALDKIEYHMINKRTMDITSRFWTIQQKKLVGLSWQKGVHGNYSEFQKNRPHSFISLHVRYTSIDSHLFRSIPSPFLLGFCDQDPQKSGCEGFASGTYVWHRELVKSHRRV